MITRYEHKHAEYGFCVCGSEMNGNLQCKSMTPTPMNDWCPNGCQDLCGLGECGMCGYEGDGVDYWDTDYVIDADEETGRYVRKPNPDRMGSNAEKPSTLAFLAGVAAGFLGL